MKKLILLLGTITGILIGFGIIASAAGMDYIRTDTLQSDFSAGVSSNIAASVKGDGELELSSTVSQSADLCVGGVASASSNYSNPLAAFDGDDSTDWYTADGNPTGWIAYKFISPQVINHYSIVAAEDGAPKDWTFEGYDGSEWVTLDTQTNQINWIYNSPLDFSFENSQPFIKYRLNITASNDIGGFGYLDIYEFLMKHETVTYSSDGVYTSPIFDISSVKAVQDNIILWNAAVPNNTSLAVETRLSDDKGVTWSAWEKVKLSGNTIPGIEYGSDLTNTRVQYRIFFSTSDTKVTPKISDITINIITAEQTSMEL